MSMQRLPPLNSLKAFDAAARHLSFTAAAAELHVTHGAVSRQIAALEEELHAALFIRGSRGLKLTQEGAQLAGAVGSAFAMMRSAVAQVRQAGPTSALRVSVPPTLAMRWLIPRMTALHHAHPRLRIELSTSTEPVDFDRDPVDAAIRRIARTPKGVIAERFLDGRSVPVCSPAYQQQHRMRSPADLERATLIVTRSEPEAWPQWLRNRRVPRREGAATIEFEQLYFALQAALDSLGVALVPIALVETEIRAGRLKALADPEGQVSTAYALLSPRVSAQAESIRTLGEWLKQATASFEAS
ncbi:LysR family transcriptional regulator [Ramlibacter henchirensis]|uniref:LysR family transcriptional regulator n=1 Tax=Ramlibacter henchirensis TaxID=204072 RepID=A0A4Z0C5C3_9BURK|nr:LysR substrate-binding domain-containing protein [Ramlibacter henchirensis]TFZ05548.1 LysR family transcriptional regulator [Ramlibacter henchirensis]